MKRRKFLVASVAASLWQPSSASPANEKGVFVVGAGKDRFNEPVRYQGVNPNLVKISGKDTNGLLSVFEYEGFVKTGPPLHVHLDQDEIFYVAEGEFLFKAGEEQQILKAGETIFLPRKIPHTWLQLSEKGKLLYLLQPAGKLEAFFKKMNALKRPPTFEEEQTISRAHGVETLGPPLKID